MKRISLFSDETAASGVSGTIGRHKALAIEYMAIADLTPDPKNPRVHSKKQVRQIAESIRVFGFNVPVLIDSQSQIVAGHGRVQAGKSLGITEVPTIRLEHLTEAQINAFMIADNRLTEIAAWDNRLLGEQLKLLSELELDFSLDVTGFEMGEIDLLIEGLTPAGQHKEDVADRVPAAPPGNPVSRVGDLWLLGRNRVFCGDALKPESYTKLMENRLASSVFTDPPYDLPIGGNVSGHGAVQHKEFLMAAGEMDSAEFTEFLGQACGLLARHSVPGSIHFICMDWRHTGELVAAGNGVYGQLKNLCVWVKDYGGMGSLYRSQHELIFVFKNGDADHQNNVHLGQFGRNRTNVWKYPGVNSFARSTDEGNLLAIHPTIKPVQLVADAVLDCSARGDIVLDCFLGSGTTVIAAERTGRVCDGIEIDPLYVDTIIRRWQAFTGDCAVNIELGQTFTELEEKTKNGLER